MGKPPIIIIIIIIIISLESCLCMQPTKAPPRCCTPDVFLYYRRAFMWLNHDV